MTTSPTQTWHAMSVDETFAALGGRSGGLSAAEANARLAKYGPNELPETGRYSRLRIILRQLNNPLTLILFVAMAVSFGLGENTDGVFILLVVVINVTVGAFQEWRAEASAASLKKTLLISPTVIRGGKSIKVDIAEIVPGDIVRLESGVVVPADMRLSSSHDLKIDESLLTGESKPVEKAPESACDAEVPLGDRINMAYAGAMVTEGRGAGIVCATAAHTELGGIAQALSGRGGRPPLLVRMETFTAWIAVLTVVITILLGAGQYARGAALSEVFLLTAALAVSAIPEGLPIAITVALSVASSRMGKRNVIVRSLPAVEALGSCTLIAADKTGTLTANRLTAKKIILADGTALDIEGEGLELEGAVSLADGAHLPAETRERLDRLTIAGVLTNEADLTVTNGAIEARGDTVDIAFLVLGTKTGADEETLRRDYRARSAIPYESDNGFSACLNQNDNRFLVSVKGAPEVVLPMCSNSDAETIDKHLHELTSKGFRVIALAGRESIDEPAAFSAENLQDLEFLGFVGLIDPLRSEAPNAVSEAVDAGVDIRMITGDHPETALAIAQQLGSRWAPGAVLTGAALKKLEGEERADAILRTQVYARVAPTQKNLIVSELQDHGHFVAVTGDGVNDAPALKTAHVGVAMGAGGTDVARAASDLIITDDNFASIVAGIEEGRAAYDNIRKIVWLLISTAITEVVVFALALFAGLPVPLTAVQILWLNLVTEGIQDVALAFEGKEPDIMRRAPRKPKEPIFNRQMVEQCLIVGLYIGALAFAIFYWLYQVQGFTDEASRNLVLLFLVSFNNFHTLNCRSETRSAFSIPLSANPFLIASIFAAQSLHIVVMHIPLTQHVLDVSPVTLQQWASAIGLAATVFVLGEAYKLVISRPRARRVAAQAAPASQRLAPAP
ncbi:MAG: HAD-IC family P-type ATPase [Pseudomonadota bacterium]